MGVDPTKYYKMQLRRDTADNWIAEQPILSSGEIGIDTTYNTFKIGDGQLVWGALSYANAVYPDDSLIAKLDEFIDPGFGIEMTYFSGERVYEISTTGLALQSDLTTLDGRVDANATGIADLDDRMDEVEEDIEILDIKVSGLEARSTFDIEYIIRSPQGGEVYGDAPAPSACYVGSNGTVTNNPVTINEIFLSFVDKNGLLHNFVSLASGDTFNFREENDEDVSVRFQIETVSQLASGVKLDVTMQSAISNGTVDDGDVYDCLVFPDVDVSDKADIEYVDQLFGLAALKGSANTFTAKNTFQDHIIIDGDRRITAEFGANGRLAYGTNDASKGVRMQWGNSVVQMNSKFKLYHGTDYDGADVIPEIDCRGYNIKDAGYFNTTVDRTQRSNNFNSFILRGKTAGGENQIIFKDYHYNGGANNNSFIQYLGRTDDSSSIQTKDSVISLINANASTNYVGLTGDETVAGVKTFSSTTNFTNSISMNITGRLQIAGTSGSSGQVLTSNGTNGAPSWKTPSAGSSFSPGDQVVKSSTSSTSGSFYKSGSTLYWVP